MIALVTLTVATVVYRWQKLIDRETVIHSELRALYAKYAGALRKVFLSQPYQDGKHSPEELDRFYSISDEEIEIYVLRDQIYLLAPQDVVNSVLACDKAFRDWKIAFPQPGSAQPEAMAEAREKTSQFRSAQNEMLEVMRNSLAQQIQVSFLDAGKALIRSKK